MKETTDRETVLVVDDHRTFTDLVALALRGEPDLECVGAAHDSADARRLVDQLDPDLVLMDVNLGEADGLQLTAELLEEHPELVVVVLTAFGDGSVMRRAAAVGASALLPKDGSLPDLLEGLRGARKGGLVVHPELLRTLVTEETAIPPPGSAAGLTAREQDVLTRLAEGRTVSVIARDLGISVHTCRGYVRSVLAKLGVHSQLEAVVVAVMRGLVDAPRRR
ncbi:response regulator transcription factor [Nocardioides aestuarii]|uniref:Response regulator n=1 Tax=Nocardioides aestuarii TaxID=252231 RepID=A0ABW4TR01_9ACTN